MKAIRYLEYGGVEQLRLEEVDTPRAGPGEVLIKVAAAGVNPVDCKLRSGVAKEFLPLSLPYIPGGDFSGTIIAVGAGVDEARTGERVMGMVSILDGGTYAEQIAVKSDQAVLVPDGIDLQLAAALPMGTMTGYDLVDIGLEVGAGESVVVTGAAGSVGRAAVYAAAKRGAKVVALVREHPHLPIGGASSTIVVSDEEAIAAAGPFDCVADIVGGDLAQSLVAHLRSDGRFATVVGQLPKMPDSTAIKAKAIVVSPDTSKLLAFANAFANGDVDLPATREFPLQKAAEAHALLESGRVGGKLLLIP